MLYKHLIRPWLFAKFEDPEEAHEYVLSLLETAQAVPGGLKLLHSLFGIEDQRLETRVGHVTFPNPIGLAAGFDKDARVVEALSAMGFGFITTGTFTPRPQLGHPRPRIWRDEANQVIYNRMGFPNMGVIAGSKRIERARLTQRIKIPIGASIGMQKDTPEAKAADDYVECLRHLHGLIDYGEVNVSSPNTEGLRKLQRALALQQILRALSAYLDDWYLDRMVRIRMPDIWVKVAPDMDNVFLRDVVELCVEEGVCALVATNTTVSRRPGDPDHPGGKSGKPLFPLALEKVQFIHEAAKGRLPIVAVGGIDSPEKLLAMRSAGATLFQFYTGLIYKGPRLARTLNEGYLRHLAV